VNAIDKYDKTLLLEIAEDEHLEIVNMLLEK
jgi:hypothetical protein